MTRVPGLVDIHVHGLAGFDVMAGDANAIVEQLRLLGVEWCCPTTVCADAASIQIALGAIEPTTDGFAGVHLEGPFISRFHSGAQPIEDILPEAGVADFREIVGPFENLIRIVTLAPEIPGARELIDYLTAAGKIVSAGHTDAVTGQLAVSNSVAHVTHCYNAMRSFHHREPGILGFALLSDVYCELIYDRVHVHRDAAELLLRLKPDKVIAISDGTAAAGMPDGWSTRLWGYHVERADNAVRLENGALAGSAATLADVFKFLWQDFGPQVAIDACSTNPRRALGLPDPKMWLDVDDEGTIIEVLKD